MDACGSAAKTVSEQKRHTSTIISCGRTGGTTSVTRRIFCVSTSQGGPDCDLLEVFLWRNAGIRIHVARRNRAGTRRGLERAAQAVNPNARVWLGSLLPIDRRGIPVVTPIVWHGTIKWTSKAHLLQILPLVLGGLDEPSRGLEHWTGALVQCD